MGRWRWRRRRRRRRRMRGRTGVVVVVVVVVIEDANPAPPEEEAASVVPPRAESAPAADRGDDADGDVGGMPRGRGGRRRPPVGRAAVGSRTADRAVVGPSRRRRRRRGRGRRSPSAVGDSGL
jgi:hypothetical protein